MANLAIRGHATRGKEVIEILKMLGGDNSCLYATGNIECLIYFISENKRIIEYSRTLENGLPQFLIFTLEEFLEKFPYKVGDKVKGAKINDFIGRITNVRWDDSEEEVIYVVEWNDVTKSTLSYYARGLQPYKEEIMKETIKINIPKGYEFAGVDDDNQQVVFEKIEYQYPKTYEECCVVLGTDCENLCLGYAEDLLDKIQSLLICRDAYWKIAGEQMGLGKPWEPDWNDVLSKYYISFYENKLDKGLVSYSNKILAFPSEEMLYAFYENFKELIESVKELL